MRSKFKNMLEVFFKSIKSILRIVCKRIINVRKALLKCYKTGNYVVLNCGVRPLNNFSQFL